MLFLSLNNSLCTILNTSLLSSVHSLLTVVVVGETVQYVGWWFLRLIVST